MSLKSSSVYWSCTATVDVVTEYMRRDWREKQAEEIKARDEASRAKRQETIGKAEHAIDQFYEEYAAKKERNIRENKCVLCPHTRHPSANA